MYCSNCGNKIGDDDIFCPKCGNKIQLLNNIPEYIPDIDEEDEEEDEEEKSEYVLENELIRCPYCDSKNVYAHKKGFSGKKAVTGAVLTGGVGILAGTIGSNNIKITCLNCGKTFNPGDTERMNEAINRMKNMKTSDTVLAFVFFGGGIIAIIAFFIWLIYLLL